MLRIYGQGTGDGGCERGDPLILLISNIDNAKSS
jgi:hypothetical protein